MNSHEPLRSLSDWMNATQSKRLAAVDNVLRQVGSKYSLAKFLDEAGSSLAVLTHEPTSTEWVLIPSGSFARGLSAAEEQAARRIEDPPPLNLDEMRPISETAVGPFLAMRYPVSVEVATRILGQRDQATCVEFDGPLTTRPIYVGEADALALAKHFGAQLPTENQWEYMCRGGTHTLFWFGDTLPSESDLAMLISADFSKPTRANNFGLFGLFICQWCEDRFTASYDAAPTPGAPRVVRGGASALWPWQNTGEWGLAVSAARMPATDLTDDLCGVRLVRAVRVPTLEDNSR